MYYISLNYNSHIMYMYYVN